MTEQQFTKALDKANKVRLARADIRKKIRLGEISVIELIWEPPIDLANMALFEILMAQRRWGRKRVLTFLIQNNFSEYLGLQTMTDRQKVIFDNAITKLTWPSKGRIRQA